MSEELWQHFIQQKPPKGKLHLFLLHNSCHTQQLGGIFLLPPYNCIPVHPALVPPYSQYSMLAPNLLQLALPTGAAAESWEMTTAAKCTETRQEKKKILFLPTIPDCSTQDLESPPSTMCPLSPWNSTWSASSWRSNDRSHWLNVCAWIMYSSHAALTVQSI